MAVPYVGNALNGWTKKQMVKIVHQFVVNHLTQEKMTDVVLDMNLQPMPAQVVDRKPEAQREWRWWRLLVKEREATLSIDDVVVVDGIPYRVRSVQDWGRSGYVRYEATEDYRGRDGDQ